MLDRVKTYLGVALTDASKDAILTLLIGDATEYLKEYCNITFETLPTKFEAVVGKMAAEDYIKQGMQGITAQSFSGVSETLVDGYSLEVLLILNKNRKVKCL